jgi:hypothetical protein
LVDDKSTGKATDYANNGCNRDGSSWLAQRNTANENNTLDTLSRDVNILNWNEEAQQTNLLAKQI